MELDQTTLDLIQRAQGALDNPQPPAANTGFLSDRGALTDAEANALTDFQKAAAFRAASNVDQMGLDTPYNTDVNQQYRENFMGPQGASGLAGQWFPELYPAMQHVQRAAAIGRTVGEQPQSLNPADMKNANGTFRKFAALQAYKLMLDGHLNIQNNPQGHAMYLGNRQFASRPGYSAALSQE